MTTLPKVLVIVGPTAAGKTSLSIRLATRYGGEVISADSRQVYRGLDLGSGKVTADEMANIPHHLLDVADPMTVYTASDFKRDAAAAIDDIINRGRLPIIAGGTFLYTDLLLGRLSAPAVPPNPALRATLETSPTSDLVARLTALDPRRADTIDQHNRRRLIRAIEIATALGTVPPSQPSTPYNTLILGVAVSQPVLHENIERRLKERLAAGMLTEVETLLAAGVTTERLEALGLEYRYLSRYLTGTLPYDVMVTTLTTKIRQFAKRQLTWLKRDPSIHWIQPQDDAAAAAVITPWLSA